MLFTDPEFRTADTTASALAEHAWKDNHKVCVHVVDYEIIDVEMYEEQKVIFGDLPHVIPKPSIKQRPWMSGPTIAIRSTNIYGPGNNLLQDF